MTIKVRIDNWRGRVIAEFDLESDKTEYTVPISCGIIGKRAVYFEFCGDGEAEFDRFTFNADPF